VVVWTEDWLEVDADDELDTDDELEVVVCSEDWVVLTDPVCEPPGWMFAR